MLKSNLELIIIIDVEQFKIHINVLFTLVCITLYLSLFSADKIDVMRDIFAYMVVLAIIIGVAYDGTVKHYHVFSYSAKFLDGL